MGTPVSRAILAHLRNIFAALLAALLAFTLVPPAALAAEGEGADAVAPSEGSQAEASDAEEGEGVSAGDAATQPSAVPSATIAASSLIGKPTSFVSADVALGDDAEPVVGSFTVDGLTFSISEDGATLVAVAPGAFGVDGPDGGRGEVPPSGTSFALGSSEPSAPSGPSEIPSRVSYGDAAYDVVAIDAFAFYLSGATEVLLPASIASVDDRAFRSSDVARVEVDPANPNIASFGGCLYDSQLQSLLLIPEGRAGAILLPKTAEVADPSKFSHCSLVDAISVEEGGAAFASWEGLLYSADGTTLLRVPAGATDSTIREGCTAIAAGAMEGCAKLESINAPSTVTSISPDVFASVPTVSLPALSALLEGDGPIPQVSAVVALSATEGSAVKVDPSRIKVSLAQEADSSLWAQLGFDASGGGEGTADLDASRVSTATLQEGQMNAASGEVPVRGGVLNMTSGGATSGQFAIFYTVTFDGSVSWTGGSLTSPDSLVTIKATSISSMTFFNEAYFNKPGQIVERITMPSGYWYETRHMRLPTLTLQCKGGDFLAGNTWLNDSSRNPSTQLDMNMCYSGTMVTYVNAITNRFLLNDGTGAAIDVPSPQGSSLFLPKLDAPMWTPQRNGYEFKGWFDDATGGNRVTSSTPTPSSPKTFYAHWNAISYALRCELEGGAFQNAIPSSYTIESDFALGEPVREGYRFLGWTGTGLDGITKDVRIKSMTGDRAYVAHWERADYDVSFDVDSEPGDEDYPGDTKDDEVINIADGAVEIENPTRPGYVFQGWAIPNAGGTEAIDQELVYEEDGKWYVDASKLPDYAGDDGKVELTARWTSVISVDVPSSVTFYADTVTQGSESRDGLADRAFGQSKVQSQSQVDLRIVGLESQEVKGDGGSSLGASDVLVSKGASTPADSAWKLFSLYPSKSELAPEDLQDPDRVSATPEGGVTFGLDDVLLEKSFSADDFTIPAGDTLSLGYRLNLEETGTSLDYGKLSQLPEGGTAALASISYCFAAEQPSEQLTDPLWIENRNPEWGAVGFYGLADIKAAALDLSANASNLNNSKYYKLFKAFLDNGALFNLRVTKDGATRYYPVHLIGICQDTKIEASGASKGKAGLTFAFKNSYREGYVSSSLTATSWPNWDVKTWLNGSFLSSLEPSMRNPATGIEYVSHRQQNSQGQLQLSNFDKVFIPNAYEVWGTSNSNYNPAENSTYCFQYQYYAKGGVGFRASPYRVKTNEEGQAVAWWTRTSQVASGSNYLVSLSTGAPSYAGVVNPHGIVPCFAL